MLASKKKKAAKAVPSMQSSEVKLDRGKDAKEEHLPPKVVIVAMLQNERVVTEDSNEARELFNKSRYGTLASMGKVQLSLTESYYLIEKGKIEVVDGNGKKIGAESFAKRARRLEPNFWVRYCVYREFRDRGYIIKTALKFGADFRVYDRGIKPGDDHAKWIVYPVHEASTVTWYEFAAKNRVAHSTKKNILIAVVDDENDVSFWEVRWKRP